MDHDETHLGDRLARLRRLADLTQESLSERSGVSIDVIRKLEQHRKHSARLPTDRLDVDLAPVRGHIEALCGHQLPTDAATEEGPSGATRLTDWSGGTERAMVVDGYTWTRIPGTDFEVRALTERPLALRYRPRGISGPHPAPGSRPPERRRWMPPGR